MKSVFLQYDRTTPQQQDEPLTDLTVTHTELELFTPRLFGMETFNAGASLVTSLAAIYDLEGFTNFSSQNDPHLSVPGFIDEFLTWLFSSLKKLSIERTDGDKVYLYCSVPFFAKFLGDGVLFLWEIDYRGIEAFCAKTDRDHRKEVQGEVGNIISVIYDTCRNYSKEFYPKISRSYSRVPKRLRCGLAQGLVCSLGGGVDYVGPCINMAARLQKLGSLGLCILQRGIDLDMSPAKKLSQLLIRKKTQIRGSGEEIIYVVREEFQTLKPKEKREFQNP